MKIWMWPYIKEKDNVHWPPLKTTRQPEGQEAETVLPGGAGGVIHSYIGLVGGGFGRQDMIVLTSWTLKEDLCFHHSIVSRLLHVYFQHFFPSCHKNLELQRLWGSPPPPPPPPPVIHQDREGSGKLHPSLFSDDFCSAVTCVPT